MAQSETTEKGEYSHPIMLDKAVPLFTARSTHGEISIENFRGSWVILFSHPADFTPVCTSQFIAFQRSIEEFNSRKCTLIGLSVDSIYSHVAWVRNIEEKFGVKISFPIVEDISMNVSKAYGMLDKDSNTTATIRSVFFIDPNGILRAKIYYPIQIGRSIPEIIRTLSALQAVDEHGLSAPADWKLGDKMIPMAPTTTEDADNVKVKSENADWYYSDVQVIN